VRVSVSVQPGWLWWGATWSVICGAAAAWPWPTDANSAARLAVAWLVAVPLLGAVWTHVLQPGAPPEAPEADGRPHAPWLDWWPGPLAAALAAVATGAVLGPGVGAVALATVIVAAAAGGAGISEATGVLRSAFEIVVPALVGWLSLGGPARPPAALAVANGALWTTGRWLIDNGPLLGVLLAFALVHHGATTAVTRRDLDRRWWELVAGQVTAAALLAAGGHALGAAWVALLFVAQWPMQSAMRGGKVLWHLRHAQWLAMAAMLVAMTAAS
jgi:hypothetical protein